MEPDFTEPDCPAPRSSENLEENGANSVSHSPITEAHTPAEPDLSDGPSVGDVTEEYVGKTFIFVGVPPAWRVKPKE